MDDGCDCLLYNCDKKQHNTGKRGIASGASFNRGSTIRPNVEPGLPSIPAPSGGSNIVDGSLFVGFDVLPPIKGGSAVFTAPNNSSIERIASAVDAVQRRMEGYLQRLENVQTGRTQMSAPNSPGIPVRSKIELFGEVKMKKAKSAYTQLRPTTQCPEKITDDEEHIVEDIPVMWTLEEALVLIREMRPKLIAHGYTLELGGGVLQNGFSHNDLDLVLVPRLDTRPYPKSTIIWLFECADWKPSKKYKADRGHLQIYHIEKSDKLIDLIFVELGVEGGSN